MKFYSQLNTSGSEPPTSDTPVSHSIDIPTEELKNIVIIGTTQLPPTIPAPTRKHINNIGLNNMCTYIPYIHTYIFTVCL